MPDNHGVKQSQGYQEYIKSCIATGLKSATVTLVLLNHKQVTGLPVNRILVRSLCYGIGAWLWFNLVAQIAVNFQ